MGTQTHTLKLAAERLSDCERGLRELVGTAAAAGEYDAVALIAEWAKLVGGLSRAAAGEPAEQSGGTRWSPPAVQPSAANGVGHTTVRQVAAKRAESAAAAGVRRRPPKGTYPKFFRQGDQLVKVGWSKKAREEYTHKAPKRVAEALAAAIVKRAANGKPFTAEQIFPLTDPQDGGEVPAYQGYVALAWFRAVELVKQTGRSKYLTGRAAHLPDALVTHWMNLQDLAD